MRKPHHSLYTNIFLLIVLGWATPVAAVTLDLTLQGPGNLQAFFLEDLNISGQAPSEEVFRATVVNELPTPIEVYFQFSLNNAQLLIASGRSNNFNLYPGILSVSNLDLTAPNNPYQLDDYEISSQAEEIQNLMLQTGYLPAGTYIINLDVCQSSTYEVLAHDEIVTAITNPFTIQLLSPSGNPSMPTPMTTLTPLFVWSSQAGQYILKICERISPDQDPESVLQNLPHYQTSSSEPLTSLSFTYPLSGVRPLESGRTYYWQVTALVSTSSGFREYPSAIAGFTITDNLDPQAQRIMTAVQMILNSGNASVLEDLTGFQPNGIIRLDGLGITIEDLESLARKFSQGEYQSTSVRAQ
jgi:hypothetical protein